MPSELLNVTVVQPDILWEDKKGNIQQYEQMISGIGRGSNIIVLPEMFTTGFSMDAAALSEPMDGPSIRWMKDMAARYRCIMTGSLIIEEHGHYYNRMLWVQPDGYSGHYDKRHLFAYGGEDKYFSSGSARLIVSVNGWRVCLQICYDLRFPVWARNANAAYDILLYVANWPAARSLAWNTLLQARAIENLCYCIGVNRTGVDGNGLIYAGGSIGFGPLGEPLWQQDEHPGCYQATMEKTFLQAARSKYPFLDDGDQFVLVPGRQ